MAGAGSTGFTAGRRPNGSGQRAGNDLLNGEDAADSLWGEAGQ